MKRTTRWLGVIVLAVGVLPVAAGQEGEKVLTNTVARLSCDSDERNRFQCIGSPVFL